MRVKSKISQSAQFGTYRAMIYRFSPYHGEWFCTERSPEMTEVSGAEEWITLQIEKIRQKVSQGKTRIISEQEYEI